MISCCFVNRYWKFNILCRLIRIFYFLFPRIWNAGIRELFSLQKDILEKDLEKIKCPVTVLHGEKDEICSFIKTQEYFKNKLAGVKKLKIVQVLDFGHHLVYFHPDKVITEIAGIVREIELNNKHV